MPKAVILLCMFLHFSSLGIAAPSKVFAEAIKQEWLDQIGVIARDSLKEYNSDFGAETFLPSDSWVILKLEVTESGEPSRAMLRNGETAFLEFEMSNGLLKSTLDVSTPERAAWIIHFRIANNKVELDRVVEAFVPHLK